MHRIRKMSYNITSWTATILYWKKAIVLFWAHWALELVCLCEPKKWFDSENIFHIFFIFFLMIMSIIVYHICPGYKYIQHTHTHRLLWLWSISVTSLLVKYTFNAATDAKDNKTLIEMDLLYLRVWMVNKEFHHIHTQKKQRKRCQQCGTDNVQLLSSQFVLFM